MSSKCMGCDEKVVVKANGDGAGLCDACSNKDTDGGPPQVTVVAEPPTMSPARGIVPVHTTDGSADVPIGVITPSPEGPPCKHFTLDMEPTGESVEALMEQIENWVIDDGLRVAKTKKLARPVAYKNGTLVIDPCQTVKCECRVRRAKREQIKYRKKKPTRVRQTKEKPDCNVAFTLYVGMDIVRNRAVAVMKDGKHCVPSTESSNGLPPMVTHGHVIEHTDMITSQAVFKRVSPEAFAAAERMVQDKGASCQVIRGTIRNQYNIEVERHLLQNMQARAHGYPSQKRTMSMRARDDGSTISDAPARIDVSTGVKTEGGKGAKRQRRGEDGIPVAVEPRDDGASSVDE